MQDHRADEEVVGRIREIWRYPVKSMLGERLKSASISERGLLGDRAYAMIDRQTGKAASAKNPRTWPNLFSFRATYRDEPQPELPTPDVSIALPGGNSISSDSPNVGEKLSEAVGRPVRLAKRGEESTASGEGYWPDHEWLAERDVTFDVDFPPGTFFDGSMLHLITTGTLEHLQSLSPASQFDVRRFRPNLVIETKRDTPGFVENDWIGKSLVVGDILLRIDRGCPRCVMTTLPVEELPKDPTILRTAVQKNQGFVGVYVTVLRGGRVDLDAPVRLA